MSSIPNSFGSKTAGRIRLFGSVILIITLAHSLASAQTQLPMPQREFRAAWVASVANIDWPSKPGLSTEEQKKEFERIVDRAADLNLNALIFQIRPAADALFKSAFEPWSPYLTGTMGKAPKPFYDPLQFAIETAHAKAIELHVWFNPYRALHKTFKGEVSPDHISKKMPKSVKEYGGYLWLDPGDRQAAQHSLDVMLDVVRRYDIDGVHMDDYFYPYPVNDEDGKEIPFPDDESFAVAEKDGYNGDRDDWRRSNVDWLVEQLHHYTKDMKPWVKVGISPFGIWRPGHPESITGFDAYDKLYADAKKWFQSGWVDYLTPQLYWKIDSAGQSYPKLLAWWSQQNSQNVQLWPGNYTSRVGMTEGTSWDAAEILNQIKTTREFVGATGNVHFSMKSLFDDYSDLGQQMKDGPYRQPAIVPAIKMQENTPQFTVTKTGKAYSLSSSDAWLWVVWQQVDKQWSYQIRPRGQTRVTIGEATTGLAVTAVNRIGAMSNPKIIFDRADQKNGAAENTNGPTP